MDADAVFCNECGSAASVARSSEVTIAKSVEPLPISKTTSQPVKNSESPTSQFPKALVDSVRRRYREGYLYARTIDGFGIAYQVIGVIVAILGLILGFALGAAASNPRDSFGPDLAFLGFLPFIIGLIFGAILFITGVVVRAGAQLMKASFDSAVNNSPFLTNDDRAEMMSLSVSGGGVLDGIAFKCAKCGLDNDGKKNYCVGCGAGL
ncbi:MAG: hypothetical protein M9893_03025 [Pyrinomonadaceae bacterium]|nr:hypothetical protein [Pyrinomonadaceae bacterium]